MLIAFAIFLGLQCSLPAHAIFGMELGPLLQLVAGQVQEIERLAETVGVLKDQRDLLLKLNQGIEKTIAQIESIQSIIDRAHGLDPRAIRTVADLNRYIDRLKDARQSIDSILLLKVEASANAVSATAEQSETSYIMGQEMIATGALLAAESKRASPGRSAQIQASAASAQMLAKGVELQTLAHLAQLQALTLELERSKIARDIRNEQNAQLVSRQSMRTFGASRSLRRLQ